MPDYPKDELQKFLAIAGIAGPIIYFVVLNVLGFLQEGYNPIINYLSELGAVDAPFGPVMQFAGFSLMGVFILLFSIALYHGTRKDIFAKTCAVLFIAGAISLVAVGFFPCDSRCMNITETGKMHGITATIPAILLPIAIALVSYSLEKDSNWGKKWRNITLAFGIASIALSPLTMFDFFKPVIGLVQRLGMFVPLLWMLLVSIRLFKLAKTR